MKTREELAEIFEDTRQTIIEGSYYGSTGKRIILDDPTSSFFYKSVSTIKELPGPANEVTRVYVQNIDTFLKAKEMGDDCVVLNMASPYNPGGGVVNGSRAQEEDLCRRSNLMGDLARYSSRNIHLFNYPEPGRFHYPIPVFGGIYTGGVTVFRSAQSYSFLEDPYKCSVITVAGVKNPELGKDGLMGQQDVITFKGKIRAIIRIAVLNGHRKLVLGALGCGAFHCPPYQVATLFKEVISEKEFKGWFSEICFAILDDRNSGKDGNFKPFKEVIGDVRV